ncbi:hypothetical protein [Stenotrophomonas maltophilia]|uniref:hypothetical protein n=1 Tax=Stenotrophomonas maltophilia TaxID=40324 RepID=UPI0020904399|nr:hypothetical protein [Stenotrophomonas maltophilia]MCO5735911.1 hypothetical protein [Stenotrophomonas maltophilia]
MNSDTTFKDQYYFELQRRDALNNGLTLSVGILTLLVSGMGTMLGGATLDWGISSIVLCTFWVLTAVPVAAAFYCVVRSLLGYEYGYFPDALEMGKARDGFLRYHAARKECSKEAGKKQALSEYGDMVEGIYAKHASRNGGNNDKRAEWAFRTNRWLVAGLIGLVCCGLAYLSNTIGTKDKSSPIMINFQENRVMTDKPAPQPNTPQRPSHPPAQLTRPAEPASRYAKDHALPKK